MSKAQARKRYSYTNYQFVTVWRDVFRAGGAKVDVQHALSDVAGEEIPMDNITARATNLRKKGVHLPKFTRGVGTKVINVDELNAILAEDFSE